MSSEAGVNKFVEQCLLALPPAISKLINKNILLQTEHPGCTDPSWEKELSGGGIFIKVWSDAFSI